MARRIASLDGLRGVAILAVMAYHFPVRGAASGYLGVDVFFTLSGFLITTLLISEWQATGGIRLRRFYWRRAWRLFPALAVLLIVWWPALAWRDVLGALSYVGNWIMALQLWPMDRTRIGHTWSLSLEEQFYALWPAVLLLLLRRRVGLRGLTGVALALAAASLVTRVLLVAAGAGQWRVYYGSDTHADGLLLGSALGLALLAGWRPSRAVRVLGVVAILLAAAVLLSNQWPSPTPAGLVAAPLIALATAAAVVLTVNDGPPDPLKRVLCWRPLVLTGRISYSLYLWHLPISFWVDERKLAWSAVWLVGLKVGLSLAAATASYTLVEQPLRRVGAASGSDIRAWLMAALRGPQPGWIRTIQPAIITAWPRPPGLARRTQPIARRATVPRRDIAATARPRRDGP